MGPNSATMEQVRVQVAEAFLDNAHWMKTAVDLVDFILSECSLDNVGNDEYDNVILANPDLARAAAQELDSPTNEEVSQ